MSKSNVRKPKAEAVKPTVKVWNDQTPERLEQDRIMDKLNHGLYA
jgi:hypothetical protein